MKTMQHICTIEKPSSRTGLPPLPDGAGWWQRHCRNIRTHILVSDRDPRIIEYYRTTTGLMEEKRRQINSKYYYMIHPFSNLNTIHEAVMYFVFLLFFVMTPFSFAYERTRILEPNSKNIILSIANILCIGDIILRFFTGYIEPNLKVAVLNQSSVAMHYILGPYFICDVISSLPTDIYGYLNPTSTFAKFAHFLRLFKLVRFPTFFGSSEKTVLLRRLNKTLLDTFRYIMFLFIVVHWATCANSFVPQAREWITGQIYPLSWTNHVFYTSKHYKYQISLFRTAGMILCALSSQPDNFQDLATLADSQPPEARMIPMEIDPLVETKGQSSDAVFHSPVEEILMDLANIILGKLITTAFGVIILSRIFEWYTLETKYQAIMNQLHEFMKNKKLPLAMRNRLVQYYEHRYQQKYFKEEVITAILSENLRKEVNVNVCKQLVNIVNIFSELPSNILADVLGHLKAEVYLPNDIIIKAGTEGDCMYFLASGTVSVYTPSGREVCHLQDGAYFGEISLILKNTKRTTDIIAIEVCEVYRLDKKAFRSCFKYDKYGVFDKMQATAEERLQKTALLEETYKLELFQKAYTDKH